MPRAAWIALSASAVALVVGLVVAVLVTGGGSPAPVRPQTVTGSGSGRLELPLERDPQALMVAKHERDLLVGLAARPGGPVEVAALRGEHPLEQGDLSFSVGSQAVEAKPCGGACFRLEAKVLNGSPVQIRAQAGRDSLTFRLPAQLPQSGEALFAHAEQTMEALRSFRYTERLSSGAASLVSSFDVEAPDRLRLRTSTGFRAVIIGGSRWDFQGGRWVRSAFPGLREPSFTWTGANHARVLGRGRLRGRPVTLLALFDRRPVPAWYQLLVEPTGRVLVAEMIAPSHFMQHEFRDFDGPVKIEPPTR